MVFFGSGIIANSGAFYAGVGSSPADGIPQNLNFYRTSQDGIYTFWWGFLPAFITPSLATAGFDLQLDTNLSFSSPNLVTFTQLTAITFQNGNVVKGFAVPVAARIYNTTQTWYAQVRTHTPSYLSAWSIPLTWTIPQSWTQLEAENLMNDLPDAHVYGKEDLKLPVDQRMSLLYTIDTMYGQQYDGVYYENLLTASNNYIELCQDEFLYPNFGIQFSFSKPTSMQYVDYRWILINLIAAALVGSTNEAITLTVQAFTGVPPSITNIRDLNDFFLVTIQDAPIVPSGSQSVFHTSQPYVDATLVVYDLSPGPYLWGPNPLVPSSAYTTDGALGTWTMNSPTTDTLQAIYDIGNLIDPVIFDALQGATPLAGLVTFTNGSSAVVGTGTSFLSLSLGQQITDPVGIYLGTIEQITDNTHLTLVNPWFGPTEVITAYLLEYTDVQIPVPILWDKSTLAFGVLVTILNPGNFPLY